MRTAVLTGWDEAFADLGILTSREMLDYAKRHGFDLHLRRETSHGRPPNWMCIEGTLDLLSCGYERVIWMEADILITNPDHIPTSKHGLNVSLDWGADAADDSYFSTCAYVAHPDAMGLLHKLLSMEPEWRDKPFPCQGPLQQLYRDHAWIRHTVHVHSRRTFNAVPTQIEGTIDPWQQGDWLCHLTHIPVEERARLFYEIKAQIS